MDIWGIRLHWPISRLSDLGKIRRWKMKKIEPFKSEPFKKWIHNQIKIDISPVLWEHGYKRGRANSYVRERNGIVQSIEFYFDEAEVHLSGGIDPIYFPFGMGHCMPFDAGKFQRNVINGISAQSVFTEDGWFWGTEPETIHEWKILEMIIKEIIVPQFDAVQSLEELMLAAPRSIRDKPPSETWKGIFLYIDAIYDCLTADFNFGMEELRQAQECKKYYLNILEMSGDRYGKKGDYFSVIYDIIDEFCNTVTGENCNKETFLTVYEKVCNQARKWFKV